MKSGPIQAPAPDPELERVFKTDVDEKEYKEPQVTHPTIGSRSHEGIFACLDFWTRGTDMILSSDFTTRKSFTKEWCETYRCDQGHECKATWH
jgi:hypothetical protein